MPNTEEQRLDVIENCSLLLTGILIPFDQTDDTPEGRMITQLKWLKEHAENHDLPLPVDKGKLASLLYIYTNGNITHLARSDETIREDVEIYMKRLIKLGNKGKLLYKEKFRPYLVRLANAMMHVIDEANRPLSEYEQGLVSKLEILKQFLIDRDLCTKLKYFINKFCSKNFRFFH